MRSNRHDLGRACLASTNWAAIFASQPFGNAVLVESVEAGQEGVTAFIQANRAQSIPLVLHQILHRLHPSRPSLKHPPEFPLPLPPEILVAAHTADKGDEANPYDGDHHHCPDREVIPPLEYPELRGSTKEEIPSALNSTSLSKRTKCSLIIRMV